MKRFSATLRQLSLVAAAALAGVSGAVAQSYYDDDIYYDASKATKKEPKKPQARQSQAPSQQQTLYYYDGADYVPWTQAGIYTAASEYQPTGSSTRDVDEYNRQGSYASAERPDSISLAEFEQMSAMSNTERLARFHDSEAAQEADPSISYNDLGNEYYDNGSGNNGTTTIVAVPTSSVSFNFGVGYPYYNSWYGGWPYYSYSWPYNSWYWNDWYGPGWGWGPSWAWGPSWSWGWGPGWGAPYPPHHHWGWGWGGGRYYNDPPGATRPNRPLAGGSNGNRYYGSYGSSANRGSIYNSNGRRPATGASGTATRPTNTSRPGYSSPISRPTTGSTPAGSYSGGRGRASSTYQWGGSSTTGNRQQPTPNYNNSGSRRPSSTPSYSGSRGSSSGSYSGSRGGYSSGGGGSHRSSGGGYSGSRGRR